VSLPPAVAGALARAAALVEHDGAGWAVGGARIAGEGTAEALADALYAHWYTAPAAPPPPAPGDPPLHRPLLTAALRAAHAAAGRTESGWVVTGSAPRGGVTAARDDAVRVLRPGDHVVPVRPGVPPAPGEPVEPVARLDHLDAERGLWWTFSHPQPEPPLGRVYLDVRPATAPRALHEVSAALVGLDVPYQLKCPVAAVACARVDAIVLYHRRGDRDRILAALLARWPALGPLLDSAVPPLTCAARPGLAWVDDPGDGRSYGESRCHALGEGIAAATAAWGEAGVPARVAVLTDALRAGGIDPRRPWEVAP
jgi:hypothetical protein